MGRSRGQSNDRLYIKRQEYDTEWGGKGNLIDSTRKTLAFGCCNLGLKPFVDPVCTDSGTIYDLENILEWLKTEKTDPCTGLALNVKGLIKLNFHKNEKGVYCCPITKKELGDHSHIVAIRTTGNVYSYEAVQKLNIEPKVWMDLLTDQEFEKSDIIHLNDPNVNSRPVSEFYHIIKKEKEMENAVPTVQKPALVKKQEDPDVVREKSFTATNIQYVFRSPKIPEKITNRKGRVRMVTNFGPLEIVLHCDLCPKTCENFLLLTERGYYNETFFHRSIPNFMIQGGDPEATGKGGASAWGGEFDDEIIPSLKHDSRGIVGMANSGPNTNRSQFYFLYRPSRNLDGKHTIFGYITSKTLPTLKALEGMPVNQLNRPVEPIRIIKAGVLENPLTSDALEQEKIEAIKEKEEQNRITREKKERGLWYSNPSGLTTNNTNNNVGIYISNSAQNKQVEDIKSKKRQFVSTPPPKSKSKISNEGWNLF